MVELNGEIIRAFPLSESGRWGGAIGCPPSNLHLLDNKKTRGWCREVPQLGSYLCIFLGKSAYYKRLSPTGKKLFILQD